MLLLSPAMFLLEQLRNEAKNKHESVRGDCSNGSRVGRRVGCTDVWL